MLALDSTWLAAAAMQGPKLSLALRTTSMRRHGCIFCWPYQVASQARLHTCTLEGLVPRAPWICCDGLDFGQAGKACTSPPFVVSVPGLLNILRLRFAKRYVVRIDTAAPIRDILQLIIISLFFFKCPQTGRLGRKYEHMVRFKNRFV